MAEDDRAVPIHAPGQDQNLELDLAGFFSGRPLERSLYDVVAEAIQKIGPFYTKVHKTQITFGNPMGFAFVSLPIRRIKGRPESCIILSFGLDREVKDPRIAVASNPYPRRWTHHMVIEKPEDLDPETIDFLERAYAFAAAKKRGKQT